MPLLDSAALAELRGRQQVYATTGRICSLCTAQVWPNYCRQCDEYFMDGHYTLGDGCGDTICKDASRHQRHRKY